MSPALSLDKPPINQNIVIHIGLCDNDARAVLTQVDDTNKPGSVYANVFHIIYTFLTCPVKSDIATGARTSFSSSR